MCISEAPRKYVYIYMCIYLYIDCIHAHVIFFFYSVCIIYIYMYIFIFISRKTCTRWNEGKGMLGGHGVKHSTKPHTGHGWEKHKNTRLKRTKRRQVYDDNNTKLSRIEMINRSPEKKWEMNNPSHAGNASLCGRLKRHHFARCEIYASAASFQDNHAVHFSSARMSDNYKAT